jgi:hypothetical protein
MHSLSTPIKKKKVSAIQPPDSSRAKLQKSDGKCRFTSAQRIAQRTAAASASTQGSQPSFSFSLSLFLTQSTCPRSVFELGRNPPLEFLEAVARFCTTVGATTVVTGRIGKDKDADTGAVHLVLGLKDKQRLRCNIRCFGPMSFRLNQRVLSKVGIESSYEPHGNKLSLRLRSVNN